MDGTDAELVARASSGDREAFARLVERHSPLLWKAVRRAISDRESARDVFQETWLRAFENLHTLQTADKLRAWLLSIALNLTRQWLRRPAARGLPLEPDGAAEGIEARGSTGSEGSELCGMLADAVASLPPRQREVVVLRIHFERTYAEIARELDIGEESARASFYQAMRRLRAHVAPRIEG